MRKIPYFLIYTILFLICFLPGLLLVIFAISKRISDNMVESLDDLYYWSKGGKRQEVPREV